jgi:hypothetical protein
MRRATTIGAAAAVAVLAVVCTYPPLAAAPRQDSSADHGRLVLGVVRNDSMLLPFAAFDGRKWSTPWPGSIGGPGAPELPVSVASVPPKWWGGEEPRAWTLWPRGAEVGSPLTLQSLAMIPVGINRQLGFRTDQKPVLPAVPPFVLPYPKLGIAIAGDAKLRPIASVSAMTPRWTAFAIALRSELDKAEEKSIRSLRGAARWNHPFTPEQRAKVNVALEAWYVARLPDSPINLSYVEAVKKYPVLPDDDGCGLETFISGWVRHEDGLQNARANLKAVITYCDRRAVSYMLPFGELRLAGKSYWVAQMSGRDHEWYTVIEGRPDGVKYVAEYQAGQLLMVR